ncbi:RNA polymerase sigma-70 factor [Olivibacter sp. SDN3]|uniref:RNA polymerase sigma-70 factor n=1 Tax=Olivibacter sp. SDN3 TaxID=2764720 RepID=UPI0016515862|nr:RNA polymerase sigma-70 factor [Olivibacter sp. SDN3]QNL49584.1 RNA polymerase sigma-70 factor [Olivibacter sp. SDN3]
MISYDSCNDLQLLKLIQIGDHQAFNEVYNRHWEMLYQFTYRMVQDRGLSMDILQEVFVWLWEHRQKLRVNVFKTYLSVAVRYKVANYIRHNKVKVLAFKDITYKTTNYTSFTDMLDLKELQYIIQQFTDSLPNRCGEIFHLSRNEFLTNQEIAKKLDISEKTVENQITIALKKLRVHLANNNHLLFFFL